jgi:hypothetical protein
MARSQLKDYFGAIQAQQTGVVAVESSEMDAAMIAVAKAGNEVLDTVNDYDTAVMSATGLESIVADLELTLENGGLDPVAAQFAHHAVDGYMSVLGVEDASAGVPSCESFGGDTTRIESTAVSVEGVKEMAKQVWETIKRIFQAIIKSVTDFFSKLFGGVDKLEGRVKALQEKVDKLKTDGAVLKDEKAKLKVHGASQVAYKGDFKASDATAGSKVAADTIKEVNNGYIVATEKAMQDMGKVVKDKGEKLSDDDINKVVSESSIAAALKDRVDAELPGAKTIMSEEKDGVTSLKFGKMEGAKEVKGELEVDPMSIGDMETILKGLVSPVKDLAGMKKNTEDFKKSLESFQKDIESAAKDGISGKATKAVNVIAKESASLVSSANGWYFGYVGGLLKNVEKNAALYGAKEEKKDDKKEEK